MVVPVLSYAKDVECGGVELGRRSRRLIPGQSLRAWLVFRQERTGEMRAVFRSEENHEKTQRELKVVQFCLCGKL